MHCAATTANSFLALKKHRHTDDNYSQSVLHGSDRRVRVNPQVSSLSCVKPVVTVALSKLCWKVT